jgi:hypothetical protein
VSYFIWDFQTDQLVFNGMTVCVISGEKMSKGDRRKDDSFLDVSEGNKVRQSNYNRLG